jgi:putative flavoprotein involved in K+ transport
MKTAEPEQTADRTPLADHDVVIVGAGQAGLATAYYLTRAGVDVQVLERAPHVGSSWARRWDSLRLFTPVRYDGLPGMPFPGRTWSYPGKDDVAAYLAEYVERSDLPVRTGADVTALTWQGGTFALCLAGGETIAARRVVIATGAFGAPHIPEIAAHLQPDLLQLHTDDYRNPDQFPSGVVLVVGGGNSGYQIAQELAGTDRDVHLANGSRARFASQRLIGRDLFWWLTTTRIIHASGTSGIGRSLRANEPVIGVSRRAVHRAGIALHPRVIAANDCSVSFADGNSLTPAAVVWATGYRHDDRWLTIPEALNQSGALVSLDGRSAFAGLHTIGRPWQRDRGLPYSVTFTETPNA